MAHIFQCSGPGEALGSESVVLAKDRREARKLHAESTAYATHPGKDGVKILQRDVVLRIGGKVQKTHVFYSDDGDY